MVGEVFFPEPRGELGDPLGGMYAHALEHVHQIAVGIDVM